MTQHKKLFVWLSGTVIFLAVLYFGSSFILFSPQIAHYSTIISLRRYYLEVFLPKLKGVEPIEIFSFRDSWMPFTLMTRQKKILADNQIEYVHCFLGKFQTIDFQKKLLHLVDKRGNQYSFRFNLTSVEGNNDILELKINSFNVHANPSTRFGSASILVNKNRASDSATSLKVGDIFRVCWDDKRPLWQSLKDSRLDIDHSVNIDGQQIFEITKYVQN